ncbi:transposase, MuDR, plant [Tanacetum coccineum]
MFDANFMSRIYNVLPRDEYAEKYITDKDNLGDHWPIHDPTIKWKLMTPVLGEKYESPEQLKRALAFYALANGYKTFEYGTLITSNWIARNYAKKIMMNPCIKVKEIIESILKKYKCKVKISQARRGKMKALQQYETCLEDHYGMLWSYASEILNSNPGSTCKMSVDSMPDGKNYFSRFYVCFKGLREGWLQGCRRVIGLDGCFLKTICKGELLSAVGRDGNNQIYPIAWAVVSVENKDNWSWFMELLINDLGLVSGEGLTIISDQHKGIIEAVKQIMNLFWKAKATYPTRFEKVMKHIQSITKEAYKHLMDRQLESWNKAYFTTNKACDFVENENSECFNALIVDARRKPIINMLEDIRVLCMERLQKMREKHEKHWNVIPSGESRFEVRNGCEGFKNMSGWYNKDIFVNAYNHYIEGMNRMDQWLSTDYQKHLPPIKRRMHGRPPHKRKRDVIEDYGNRTMIMSATCEIVSASVGKVTTTCEIVCACDGNMSASGEIVSTRGGNVFARGGKVSARGGKVFARGGIVTVSGGNVTEKGGKVTAIGGKVTTRGGKVFVRGRKVCARGGKVSTTSSTPSKSPCTSHPRFEMSILDTTSSDVRLSGGIRMRGGGAIKLREGVWIRSHKKERSSNADVDSISSSMNKLRIINGKVVTSRGRGDGSKSRMYPGGIRTIGFGVSWDSIDGHTMLGCKKQTVIATSTTEAEYVAAASCCGQDKQIEYLMLNASPLKHVKRGQDTKIPQSSGPPVKVGDEAVHKELGDRIERQPLLLLA